MASRNWAEQSALCMLLLAAALWAVGCGGGGGFSFQGTVVVDDEQQTPVPDARVVVGGVLTRTDAAGKFKVSNPVRNADGKVFVSVSKTGYRSFDQALDASIAPVIKLSPRALTDYGLVSGKVVDVTTGQGIGLVELEVQPIFGGEVTPQEEIQFTHTASDGTFEVTGFLGGNGRIIARAAGYLTQEVPISIEVGDPPPEPHPYIIALTPTTERVDVEGIVTDLETGAPLSGIAVQLGGVTATTQSDGTFTVIGVAVGQQPVAVTAEGYDPYSATITVKAGMDIVRIPLSRSSPAPDPPANVKGSVTLEGQSSNAGATVVALRGDQEVDRATTDASGAYGLLVPPGQYLLRVSATGFTTQERTVTVPALGQVLTGVDFTLAP